jgi:hypothetical protein
MIGWLIDFVPVARQHIVVGYVDKEAVHFMATRK